MGVVTYCPTFGRAREFAALTGRSVPNVVPVVDGNVQARMYRRHWDGPMIINPRRGPLKAGKATATNHVLRHRPEGEWSLFVDDDISAVTGMEPGGVASDDPKVFRQQLNHVLTEAELDTVLTECMNRAEEVGANLIGVAPYDNPMFRQKQWSECSFVVGDMWMIRQTGMEVPERHIEDLYLMAEHLLRDGRVLVNRWIRPKAKHWQEGGHGVRGSRRAIREMECRDLVERYPGLFAYREGFGGDGKMANVKLRIHSPAQVTAWRHSMGALAI